MACCMLEQASAEGLGKSATTCAARLAASKPPSNTFNYKPAAVDNHQPNSQQLLLQPWLLKRETRILVVASVWLCLLWGPTAVLLLVLVITSSPTSNAGDD